MLFLPANTLTWASVISGGFPWNNDTGLKILQFTKKFKILAYGIMENISYLTDLT